jgi:hypothetical protein
LTGVTVTVIVPTLLVSTPSVSWNVKLAVPKKFAAGQ